MANEEELIALMATAEGGAPPDLVVKGGRVVNVFTHAVELADIWIKGGRIAAVVEPGRSPAGSGYRVVDATGTFVSPGLIDAHYHVGGSHLHMADLAHELLLRGTTGLATDFYEIYSIAGPEAVLYALTSAEHAGLHVLFLPPGHLIGLEGLGTFGWEVKAADILAMLEWPEAVGVMEPPATAVLARHPQVLEIVETTLRLGKLFAGHAPGELNGRLQAYLSTGASSEHESTTAGEAEAKLRLGMRPMMRHGSAAPDLPRLIELAIKYPESTRYMMLCSDEVDPGDLVAHGHLDQKLRIAVAAGVPPVTAIQMASTNVAEYFKVAGRLGSIAPGRSADMVLFEDLKDFRPLVVLVRGQEVRQKAARQDAISFPKTLQSRVNVPGPFEAPHFALAPAGLQEGSVDVRVIAVFDGTLVSQAESHSLAVREGQILSDPSRDILKIAVAERHHGSGRIGKGFVRGFGFQSGAVAMTYCHVYHNLLVVGSSDEDMARAANAVKALGGGIAVVRGGEVISKWALPIVGLFDDRGLAEAERSFTEINESLRRIGCPLASPVLSLSFVALPTIPAYGLTDKGLIDVASQRFVDVVIPGRQPITGRR
jgi:adenine deaminase